MVRKSVLVYDLLKSEKRNNGFSPAEIFKRVSEMHNIVPGKGLKKQVDVALRRGIDFGILVKKNKKYIYDSHPNDLLNQPTERKAKARKKAAKKSKKHPKKPSTSSKSRRKRAPSSSRKQSHNPPRPRVPPPPDWTPKRHSFVGEKKSK
ncbi:uncharacterized protein [Chelonus insularis]|uniref:uncharacterized protein isoform X2 n=1 Tax=Chelonus insularis TaxID=460826 RepID=UPI00158882FC|nr:uncharacterized protein LOC118069984 isoform X2 [Chelonus insularis]